jgi:hypothetical protein
VRSQGAALSCSIAVVVCQTIDLHLQSNIRILSDIGSWVRDCIEPCLVEHPLVGWETYFSAVGSHKGPFSSFLNLERHFFTLVLFILTVVVFVCLPKKSADVPEVESEALMNIANVVVPLCVFLFWMDGLVLLRRYTLGQ